MNPRPLSAKVYASEQIQPGDLVQAAQLGFTLVVNNRPDGESPDQPDGATIADHARALGIEYAAIPVDHAGFTPDRIAALADLLEARGEGKALLYCRSGTRSTLLWALAQAKAGVSPSQIAEAAEQAGYSVAPIAGALEALAARNQR